MKKLLLLAFAAFAFAACSDDDAKVKSSYGETPDMLAYSSPS